MTDVEMATDEMFSGPLAESVPTSVSAFSHRRFRSDSTASFQFFDESEQQDQEAIKGRMMPYLTSTCYLIYKLSKALS